eukprot:360214-Chlamydomonas_euryale.AAC.1
MVPARHLARHVGPAPRPPRHMVPARHLARHVVPAPQPPRHMVPARHLARHVVPAPQPPRTPPKHMVPACSPRLDPVEALVGDVEDLLQRVRRLVVPQTDACGDGGCGNRASGWGRACGLWCGTTMMTPKHRSHPLASVMCSFCNPTTMFSTQGEGVVALHHQALSCPTKHSAAPPSTQLPRQALSCPTKHSVAPTSTQLPHQALSCPANNDVAHTR